MSVKVKGNLNKGLDKLIEKYPKEFSKVVKKTTVSGLVYLKNNYPKKSGLARKSFTAKQNNLFEHEISSPLKYITFVEKGSPARVVKAKKGKFLLFATKESAKRKSGKVREPKKRQLFNRLKKIKGSIEERKQKRFAIMKNLGVFLVKKVNIPRTKGQHFLVRRAAPHIQKKLIENLYKAELKVNI